MIWHGPYGLQPTADPFTRDLIASLLAPIEDPAIIPTDRLVFPMPTKPETLDRFEVGIIHGTRVVQVAPGSFTPLVVA